MEQTQHLVKYEVYPDRNEATNLPDIIILIYFNIGFKRLIVYNILHKSNSNSLFQVKIKNDWTA
jgi:hypothetical protein